MSWRFIEKTGFRSSITNTKRRRNAEGKTSLDGWDLIVKTATLKVGNQQNSIKIHQNVFFKKKAFRRFFSFARSSIPRPEEEKSEESEHARRRRKVAESDWNVKNKKTIRPPYWRNSTDEGKNTGVVLLRALTSTWPASPFLHAVYQTIIILSQIRLDDLVISTIFR